MKASITLPKGLKWLIAAVFWLGVWYAAAALINKEIFLPFPHTVAERFVRLAAESDFWRTSLCSFLRIIEGFLLGTLLGAVTALLTHYLPPVNILLSPLLRTVRAVPVVSFILLAFLWLDNDTIPVFIALLMVVPIIWQNISAGLSSLDRDLTEMAKVFHFSKRTTLFKVIMPQLWPHIYSGCLNSLGLAWKSGIAAEVISYPSVAIGKEMNAAKTAIETADVLVWTVVVVALSLLCEWLFKLVFKKGGRRA